MSFLRFVGTKRHPDSGAETGLFAIAYEIEKHTATRHVDQEAVRAELAWFRQNLPIPDRFSRTRSKGYYRRKTGGICWFKDTATGHLNRMVTLKRIVEQYGVSITVIREDRIGYVVYDEFQAVAEPFSDTSTG